MVFVPPPSFRMSPAATELGEKIADVVRLYQQTHPDLSRREIRGALRVAERNTCATPMERVAFAVMSAMALVIGVVLLATKTDRGAPRDAFTYLPLIVIVMIVGVLAVFLFVRRQ
jgi:hypothetical protein